MPATLSPPAYSDESLAQLSLAGLISLMIGDEDRVPRNIIEECAWRGEETAEVLSGLLHDDHYWNGDAAPGEWWLLLHTVMILGLIPGERAGLLLVAFMRRMSQAEDHDLQDWFAGYWPALFRNKPDGVLPALRALCEDRNLGWYIRANAIDAVVAGMQHQGTGALAQALEWLARLAADEQEDWELRLYAGNALLDFPRAEYRPLLDELAAQQMGWGAHFSENDIRRVYAAMNDEPPWERFKDPWEFYTPAAIERRQRRWEEERFEPDEGESESEDVFPEAVYLPYVRPLPKIGRNDPCPCGSGRKYKKCCLVTDGIQ